jgi:hypothetical protein
MSMVRKLKRGILRGRGLLPLKKKGNEERQEKVRRCIPYYR